MWVIPRVPPLVRLTYVVIRYMTIPAALPVLFISGPKSFQRPKTDHYLVASWTTHCQKTVPDC